ncbi:ADP-dependent glucokinase/phosphofructokinase [Aureimonas phyllosphaerae]|uniref:ADP-dependent phosphofructokinase/glucokinase n=1 Tax=Aureimonas phyllosphaerae TaxID=1166078 RepID=A0A7W6BT80_9HYPH|nr:ADP-dependent glucokinase/phosphofructokinase [Aureimonas phyllosphaerae]MBB3935619.1 ADP-dependent phosphofructokinase/glucokinase [Aureimonas phyllosphaerae]MBB3959627.1 ADP-dependent phosphofructokinase/glucokinase [Aureimonas phyllosphaerae]SFF13048.1 ADP-dependent phosphofructokinase/glucokinase [Aureimonas phyllosphaerae]
MHDSEADWRAAYESLVRRLPGMARSARLTLCGMSACVDARIDLSNAAALWTADHPDAAAFASMLKDRVARGVGGEVRVEWPAGPAWLAEHVPARYALGGVGPQAGWVLTTLGAPAIVNLSDRSAHMLARLPGNLLLAEGERTVRARSVQPRGARRPDIYIFEYTAGRAVGDCMPNRSSRIIVRFGDPGLEKDAAFDGLTPHLAPEAGTGLVAGFNCVPPADLDDELARVFSLTRRWRDAGLSTVHLEMSTFEDAALRDRVLDGARGAVTSLGMSHSELRDLAPGVADADMASTMRTLGERLGLDRVCVHADHWALTVTRRDADVEREALMAGCLVASTRSMAGQPAVPEGVADGATFHRPPVRDGALGGGWTSVAVPSPYHPAPLTTLGLGDTFTAGCLLVLGSAGSAGRQRIRQRA